MNFCLENDRFLIVILIYKVAFQLTNHELAKRLATPYSTIIRWLSGDCHIPSHQGERILRLIAKQMGEVSFFRIPGWLTSHSAWAIINIIAGDFQHALAENKTVFYVRHAREITFREVFSCLQNVDVLAKPSNGEGKKLGEE